MRKPDAGRIISHRVDGMNETRYRVPVTAAQIMHEIARLPPREQSKVVRYAMELGSKRPLSGDELTKLAQRMVDAADPAEADRLQEALVKGFYGEE